MAASNHEPFGQLTSLEICAGAGGQAIGLEQAGFRHIALVEYDKYAHDTLKLNMEREHGPGNQDVEHKDVVEFAKHCELKSGRVLESGQIDLLAGGVPCPPFSKAGLQLGEDDDRDLFPEMLTMVSKLKPKAVMIENVRGIMDAKFDSYRKSIIDSLVSQGYRFCGWQILEAHNFGVPQLRPRSVLIAIREEICEEAGLEDGKFPWPVGMGSTRRTVFDALDASMQERRDVLKKKFRKLKLEGRIDEAYARWKERAEANDSVAPTLVGGSRKHGGADLGPTRAKKQWEALGVNAHGVANEAAESTDLERDFLRPAGPMLTVSQAAIIQGFPEDWEFVGGKTAKYRQVGNAFPPPVARAVGLVIASVLRPELKEQLPKDLETEYIDPRPESAACTQTELDVMATAISATPVSSSSTDDCGDLVCADV